MEDGNPQNRPFAMWGGMTTRRHSSQAKQGWQALTQEAPGGHLATCLFQRITHATDWKKLGAVQIGCGRMWADHADEIDDAVPESLATNPSKRHRPPHVRQNDCGVCPSIWCALAPPSTVVPQCQVLRSSGHVVSRAEWSVDPSEVLLRQAPMGCSTAVGEKGAERISHRHRPGLRSN